MGISSTTQIVNISQETKPTYVDPGYNDDPKSLMSNFLNENKGKNKKTQQKKVIIGPGQAKNKHQSIEKKTE